MAAAQLGDRAAETFRERFPHPQQRPDRAGDHRSHRDGSHQFGPDDAAHLRPAGARRRHPAGVRELRIEEQDRRDHEPPGEDAAGETDRREPEADDVADAEIRRGSGRSRIGEDSGLGRRAEGRGADRQRPPERAVAEGAGDPVGEQLDALRVLEQLDERAEAHHLEQQAAAARALAGAVDLRRGDRFRERQLRVGDHAAPQDDDEEDAQQAAHQHEQGALQVVELLPGAGHQERREGEDGAGGQRFADGGRRAGDVLFEQAAAEQAPDHDHGDHCRREGGRDRLTGANAQVGVRRAQHHGHQQAEQQRAQREFARRAGRIRHRDAPSESGARYISSAARDFSGAGFDPRLDPGPDCSPAGLAVFPDSRLAVTLPDRPRADR